MSEAQQIEELDEAIARFEEQKRWSDMIRSILKKVDLVEDTEQKVQLLRQAGLLYIERSSNQAEAIKCYEQLLELAPEDREAIKHLKDMYEKRRDWEKLVRTMQREVELLDESERAPHYAEMADLATQRLRKPAICIELWQKVLETDSDNADALTNLAQLYERAREWEPLADVLEKLVATTNDQAELKQQLQRLGMIYTDKLPNDEKAIRAYKQLLEVEPDDRVVRDRLKTRYLSVGDWDEVEALYATSQKWDELIRIFEREAEAAETSEKDRISLLFRAAQLWEQKNDKPERAARDYEKILAIDEDNVAAAEALTPIYEQGRDARKLISVCEIRLKHAQETDDRVALLRQIGAVFEERLRQPETAFERYLSAFLLSPSNEGARIDAERLAEATNGWDQLVSGYETAISSAADPHDAVPVQLAYGKTLSRMERDEDAIAQYRQVFELESDNREAMAALAELYLRQQRHDELLKVYERSLELEKDDDGRMETLCRIAELWGQSLGDQDKAIGSYEQIINEYGVRHAGAVEALERLYEENERWADLGHLLEQRIQAQPEGGEALSALKFTLATLSHQHLGDKSTTVSLLGEVLQLTPDHERARALLEDLLNDEQVAVDAAIVLEPVYERLQTWDELIRTLRVQLTAIEEQEPRLKVLNKIATVYEQHLGDVHQAFSVLCDALKTGPRDRATLERLKGLAHNDEALRQLTTILGELGDAEDDQDNARRLWTQAAQLYDKRLGDTDSAVTSYRKVLAVDDGHRETLDALEALFRREERWSDLIDVLRGQVGVLTDAPSQIQILNEMATIQHELLGNADQAIELQREILILDPGHREAMATLEDLYASQGDWGHLAENVEHQIGATEDQEEQLALMLRLANIRHDRLGETEVAIETYSNILQRDKYNSGALAALEQLLEVPEHQFSVASLLEPIYEEAQDTHKLVTVYEIQGHHESAPEQRVAIFQRIANMREHTLGDLNGAFEAYGRAFEDDPSNGEILEHLERLYESLGNSQALADVYERGCGGIDDPDLAIRLRMRAAGLREELADAHGAIRHYQGILELDDLHEEAGAALERLYQETERYDELAAFYFARAERLTDPEAKKAELFKAAAIHQDVLDHPEQAVDVYARILELEPDDSGALDRLISLYRRNQQWAEMVEACLRKVDAIDDDQERTRLLKETAGIYELELDNAEQAIDAYQRALDIDPDDLAVLQRLDALYGSIENWNEQLSVLERQAELVDTEDAQVQIRFRIGQLWQGPLEDHVRAVDIFRGILAEDPGHEGAIEALTKMMRDGHEPLMAAGVLEPVHQAAGSAERLTEVRHAQAKYAEEPAERLRLLHELAELYEVHLDDPNGAFTAFCDALAVDPSHEPTIHALERLGEQLGTWNEVAQRYDTEIAAREQRGDSIAPLALRSAVVHEIHLDNVDGAIDRYAKVVEADPTHVTAIEALDRLYESAGRWQELTHTLQREIEIASTPAEILNLQFRTGQIYERELQDHDAAIQQYGDILAAAPEYAPAATALEGLFTQGIKPLQVGEVLEPLYRMQGDWERLLSLQEAQIEHQADPIERVSMMHRVAEVAEDKAADHHRAFFWMRRALLEDPSHDHSLQEVERLSTILDGWRDLAGTYVESIDATDDPLSQAELGRRLARVYGSQLQDTRRAEETYRFVLGVDGEDSEALEALDRIYDQHGAHDALAEVLRKRIGSSSNGVDQVDLHYRLGCVLERDLGRSEEAADVLQRLLQNHDQNHIESVRALQRIFARLQRWPELSAAMDQELSMVLGDSQQAEVLARMARLSADRLDDPERAIELWNRVLDLRGEDPEALNALGDVYCGLGKWRELVDVLEREAAAAEDDVARARVYVDLARVNAEKLGRPRDAVQNWERVLDLDPSNTHALLNMVELQAEAGQAQEQAETLRRLAAAGAATLEDGELVRIQLRLGHVYANDLNEPQEAIDAYRQALEIDPRAFDVMDALEVVYRRQGQWEDVVEVMHQRAAALPSREDQIAQLLAITDVCREQLDNPEAAVRAYESILRFAPLHRHAFEQLESLHTEAGRAEELIELYVNRVEACEQRDERIELLRKTASVYEEQLDDGEQAFHTLFIAWSEDFSNDATAKHLEEVTRRQNRWNELLAEANQALHDTHDQQTRIAIYLKCGKWYGEDLEHAAYAIQAYEQVLAMDELNAQAWWQLGDLYAVEQKWEQQAKVLAQLVDMTDDKGVKANTYVRMADLADDRFGMRTQAEDYYRRALDLQPNLLSALEALERMYREEGRANKLLNILERKAEVAEDPEAVVAARLQVAEAYETRLDDIPGAIESYEEASRLAPHNLAALRGLERLYEREGRWNDLVGILERQYEEVSTERERIEILTRLAMIEEDEFRKPDKAATRLEQVLELDPLHISSLSRLERIYRQTQSWEDLIRTYDRHANAAPDRDERIRIFTELGDVYAIETRNEERAIDSYLNVLGLDESNTHALKELARLYERTDDHARALEMMESLSDQAEDPDERVDLEYRMGQLLDQHLGDRVTASEHFKVAIDLDPTHLPSLAALRAIQIDSADWNAAAKTLEAEIEYTDTPRAKAARWAELGRIFSERLEDEERAIVAYEAAYEMDADNEEASKPLVDAYIASGRDADALPLLQQLLLRADKSEQFRLALMLGQAALRTDDGEEAVRAFQKAHSSDPSDVTALKGLAASHFHMGDWDSAYKYHQMLLVQHRDALERDEITETYYRLGRIKAEQGEPRKARNMFDKALEEDAHYTPAVEALIEICREQGDWDTIAHYKRLALDVTDEPTQRAKLLEDLGDIYKDHLRRYENAANAYIEATDIVPENHVVLHKLLATYQDSERWVDAVATIERIAEYDERPQAKAKFAYTIGVILRDELDDEPSALEKFNEALDIDPSQLKPFEAINRLLTQSKDWKGLERAFRKMLHRILGQGNTDLEHYLWHQLGIVYRDRQSNFEAAAEAFKMAAQVKPADATTHQILAELYTTMPNRLDDAIAEHQHLIAADPNRVESYRHLYKLYFDARAYDKAWCIARTLTYLGKADPDQQKLFEQYRREGPIRPRSGMSAEQWTTALIHPDQDPLVTRIMELLAPAVHSLKAVPDKQIPALRKRKPEDIQQSTVAFARTFKFALKVLSIPIPPRLYLLTDTPGGMTDVPGSHPPAIMVGSTLASPSTSGYRPKDVEFVIGRHLAFYRHEHFVRTMIKSHKELRTLLLSGMLLCDISVADAEAKTVAARLSKTMARPQIDALKQVITRFMDGGGAADVKKWMRAVELTSLRAGLVLCDDLDAAVRMAREIKVDGSVDVPVKDKVKELAIFSVSESYFSIREALGIQIKV